MRRHPTMPNSQGARKVDRMVRTLASAQRREIVRHLLDEVDTSTTVDELVQTVDRGELDPESHEIQMFHSHLPKLDDTPFIDFDSRSRVVRPRPALAELEPLLEVCEELEDEFEGKEPTS